MMSDELQSVWDSVNEYLASTVSRKLEKGDFIPESAVYKLAFKANNEVAERFQDWLSISVLPQIKSTGGYIPTNEDDSDDDILSKALIIAQRKIDLKSKALAEKEAHIQILAPKAKEYDELICSEGFIDVKELASILKVVGIRNKVLGRNGLFKKLRILGILNKSNVPYQKHIAAEHFVVRVVSVNGSMYSKTFVTPKGIAYLRKRLALA